MALRKCIVYRPIKCGLGDIKAGEYFHILPSGKKDTKCPKNLHQAIDDAKKIKGRGKYEIMGHEMIRKP